MPGLAVPHGGRGARHHPTLHRQRGAALLIAMLIVTLVATLATGMVWQQWQSVEVETAERARAESGWLLEGSLDWARLILREDARTGGPDHLGEPWAVPLAEARLSSFLAADQSNNMDNGLEAFLSGSIADAQSRYNLRNLIVEDEEQALAQTLVLRRLCEAVGLSAEVANTIARGMRGADAAEMAVEENEAAPQGAPLAPQRLSQLVWLGIDEATIDRLRPYIVILPARTRLNINTAPAEVIAAVVEGIDIGTAQRLVQTRLSRPFKNLADANAVMPNREVQLSPRVVDVRSQFFEVQGQLRYESHVLRERSIVQRRGLNVVVVQRERIPA